MNESQPILPVGKLSPKHLSQLLAEYTTQDESVIVGPRVGIDATVIDQGDHHLIATTDPITFVTENIGYYTININANDIVCMGGLPRWFLATILLPAALTTEALVEKIFSQLNLACQELNINFCGGHTEVTHGIDRPIVIGQMLGTVAKDSLITPQNIRPGDDILLTKGIAIEATSIIARERGDRLRQIYSDELVEKCKNFIYAPGISIVRDALLALQTGEVHALHDPTEGGLAMGVHELAVAGQVGIKIFENEIHIFPESKLLFDQYEIDPLGAIASGALLIVVDQHSTYKMFDVFRENQIKIKNIGKIMPIESGVKLVTNEKEIDLPEFHQDEITKLFSQS